LTWPILPTPFFYQAQIKDLGIVRQGGSFVGVGVKVIAGKFVAIPTKGQNLALGAFIGCTPMVFAEGMPLQRYSAVVVPAPFAEQDFNRHIVFLGYLFNRLHCLLVIMGQEVMTIETVQTAGSGHLKIIHGEFSFLKPVEHSVVATTQGRLTANRPHDLAKPHVSRF